MGFRLQLNYHLQFKYESLKKLRDPPNRIMEVEKQWLPIKQENSRTSLKTSTPQRTFQGINSLFQFARQHVRNEFNFRPKIWLRSCLKTFIVKAKSKTLLVNARTFSWEKNYK
jgi:hypothetical protein